MIKRFCDFCRKETKRDYVGERFRPKLGKFVMGEVVLGMDNVWNSGILCKDCLLKLINEGKEKSGKKNV